MERNSSERKALAKLFSDGTENATRHIFAPVIVEFKNYSTKDQYIIKTLAQQTANKDLSDKKGYNFSLLGYSIGFRFNFKLDNVEYALKQVPSEIKVQLYVLQRFWARQLLDAIDEDNPLGGGEEIVLSNVRRRTRKNPDDHTIADTPENIALYKLLALRAGLKLEVLGMKGRFNAYVIVKREFGFKGTKKEVLDQLNSYIQELKDNRNPLGGGQEKVFFNPHKPKKGHYASVISRVQKSARASGKRRSSAINRQQQMGVKYQW